MLKLILIASLMFSFSSAFALECILTLSLDNQPLLQNRVEIDNGLKVFTVVDEDQNKIIVFKKNSKGSYDLSFGHPFSNVLVSGKAKIITFNGKQFSVNGTVTDDQRNTARIDGVIAGCE